MLGLRCNMEYPMVFVLSVFNHAHRTMNILYHAYAETIGLSDTSFWLLYALYERGLPCTQKDLCEAGLYKPQTIRSTLKKLEDKDLIQFDCTQGNKKDRHISLTTAGKEFIDSRIAPLVRAEERSFARLNEQERDTLIAVTQKHVAMLQEEIAHALS